MLISPPWENGSYLSRSCAAGNGDTCIDFTRPLRSPSRGIQVMCVPPSSAPTENASSLQVRTPLRFGTPRQATNSSQYSPDKNMGLILPNSATMETASLPQATITPPRCGTPIQALNSSHSRGTQIGSIPHSLALTETTLSPQAMTKPPRCGMPKREQKSFPSTGTYFKSFARILAPMETASLPQVKTQQPKCGTPIQAKNFSHSMGIQIK